MELNTVEKFLLIAQHPNKGRFIISEMHINYGIVGAALLEMSLNEMIDVQKDRLVLKNKRSCTDPVINEISLIIKNSRKPRKIKYWINKLARKSSKFKRTILDDLAKKKLIRIENKKLLGLIPFRKNYLVDSKTRYNLIQELKNSILSRREISNESIVVLGLVEACKMYKIISSNRDELKKLKKELKAIIKESPIAGTLDKTIKEVQAAIVIALVASTVVTSSGSS